MNGLVFYSLADVPRKSATLPSLDRTHEEYVMIVMF